MNEPLPQPCKNMEDLLKRAGVYGDIFLTENRANHHIAIFVFDKGIVDSETEKMPYYVCRGFPNAPLEFKNCLLVLGRGKLPENRPDISYVSEGEASAIFSWKEYQETSDIHLIGTSSTGLMTEHMSSYARDFFDTIQKSLILDQEQTERKNPGKSGINRRCHRNIL